MPSTSIRLIGVATATVVLAGLSQLPGTATAAPSRLTAQSVEKALADRAGLDDVDVRGTVAPSAAQKSAASGLAASVRWNTFGTPASISPVSGTLGKATSGDAVAAARAWLGSHASLFGLSADQLKNLTLVNDQKLAGSNARAVLFRQNFGGPSPALGSMVTVGVGNGAIQYVSSSLVKTSATSVPAATLSPTAAWVKAATSIGRTVSLGSLSKITDKLGWTRFTAAGFAQEQQVRLRSLAYADGTVRPAFEANVVDVKGGAASAYTVLVDAISGKVIVRQNKVDESNDAFQFQGAITATECGPKHQFELKDANTRQIVATAAEAITTNDIVVKILDPAGAVLVTSDTATSPEVATYSAESIPAGIYAMQVCPFADPDVPFVGAGDYAAGVTTSDSGTPTTSLGQPKWRYFTSNPTLDWSSTTTPKNSVIGCWTAAAGCTSPTGPFRNVAAAGPWDYLVKTGTPSFTTVGNNANTHEAWASPLTPGGLFQAPVSPTREYTDEFTDAWNNSKCDPTQLHPTGNDINASVTNLHVAHNRMHDFSYYLGFTEENYNMQVDNLGRNDDPSRGNDPEIGNAQAGALTGGQPSFLGRDNANQIALQDGIPGITNQYLFQPLAGGFYSPCTDGSLDMSIVGHEYTHAISNRMIGGPDEGITSEQGGAMGESWGDLTAAEYMYSHGYSNGASPWAVGPYATGNKAVGIRDYAIDSNPLNYSDYGFDSPGVEVHADGEIWNGTMWEVRKALVAKYNAAYPTTDKALNLRCAQATATSTPTPATQCPGNRRWLQLVFDAFLLQQGATSMLDARDAMLAADRMRFGGANQAALWDAFARRGMGSNASTPDADSGDPTPGFASPKSTPATVKFAATGSPAGKVYIGDFEARATPVADTNSATPLSSSAKLTAGTYKVLFVAPGYGMTRSTLTVSAGQTVTKTFAVTPNLASAKNGAKVLGSSAGSLNAAALIDDTEETNWAGVNEADSVDTTSPWVAVDLAGTTARKISSVRVSAMLRPAPPGPTDGLPLLANADEDPDSGARFTALRRFAVEVCTTNCSATTATWKRIYTSAADAFPGVAPRPVAPNLTLRSFDIPDTTAAAVRLVALENQCTGAPAYAGEQDNDPVNDTDCKAGSDADLSVRAAELEVF